MPVTYTQNYMLNRGYAYTTIISSKYHGQILLSHLASLYLHSTTQAWQQKLNNGEVTLNGVTATGSESVTLGQSLVWNRPPWIEPDSPQHFEVLFEDPHLLAVNKPGGLPTLPGGGFMENTLLRLVQKQTPDANPVHRLGRATTGIVLFAKTPHAASHLFTNWNTPKIQKIYRALAQNIAQHDAYEILTPIGLVPHPLIGSVWLEANAAMRSIVRRETGESYTTFLKRLVEAEGIDAHDPAALRRLDRKRAKRMPNEDWESPSDGGAEITKLKDGRTALAYKAENAVDMETGAILAVTTHGGAAADTATIQETVIEAGVAVAGVIAEKTADGKYEVHFEGIEEVVADKGYHSNEVAVELAELGIRTYIAEPDRGPRKWVGKEAAKKAVYANRRRIEGNRGKRLQRQRGERIERNFAHQFDTGGMDRLYVRGEENVHKKLLIQAAACNLALLMRSLYGAGKPRAAHDRTIQAIFGVLAFMQAVESSPWPWSANSDRYLKVLGGSKTGRRTCRAR